MDAGPPFRADHVGSLLRPERLLRAREQRGAGEIDADELRAVEDDCVREAVALQEEIGLRCATDGEFRRASWHMDFIYGLRGIEPSDEQAHVEFHTDAGTIEFTPDAPKVTGRVGLAETIFEQAFLDLQSAVTTATPKLTIPSPSMVHYGTGRQRIDEATYPDLEGFWADVSDAYAQEIADLGDLGCTYLQIDDTTLAYVNDPAQRAFIATLGGATEHQHLRFIENMNRALRGRPDAMTVTTHLCRGNFRSAWRAQGGYDYVAEALFNDLDVDGFFLEYDDERSGGFAPLRFVPKGKRVVLGLVTTKRPALESVDELKRRVEEAARHIDVDQLCLSPQCGFSSTVHGNALTIDDQIAKLRLVVEAAEEIWDGA